MRSELISIETQTSLIEAKINTSLSLTWQIQYESCDNYSLNCFQVSVIDDRNDMQLYSFRRGIDSVKTSNFKFHLDAATTIISPNTSVSGTNLSYANVHIIMLIDDEYVRSNVSNLTCKVILSKNGKTNTKANKVRIVVTNQTMSTTTTTTLSDHQPSTSVPPTQALVCNSALLTCSSELFLKLLCFYQLLLYVICS